MLNCQKATYHFIVQNEILRQGQFRERPPKHYLYTLLIWKIGMTTWYGIIDVDQ